MDVGKNIICVVPCHGVLACLMRAMSNFEHVHDGHAKGDSKGKANKNRKLSNITNVSNSFLSCCMKASSLNFNAQSSRLHDLHSSSSFALSDDPHTAPGMRS